MEKNKFTNEEVFLAYKKLKNYYYYDNTSLFIRKRIAEFEKEIKFGDDFQSSLDSKLDEILDLLNAPKKEIYAYFKKHISCKVTPKSLKKDKVSLLTNRTNTQEIKIDRLNYFIDAPIEIHLMSVLWITEIGVYINELIDEDNYAYKLEIEDDDDRNPNLVKGYRIFKPYYLQYQSWRDNAIKTTERILSEKKDAVILSLDVKDYFHL